jgi:molybdopterin biosynthesis enzyme
LVNESGGDLTGKMIGHQSSGDMVTLSQANALLIIPSGVKSVRSGEEVKAWSLVEDIW